MADETFEGEGEESFAELFEQSIRQKPKRVQPGERVTGTVVQVGANRVYLDLGGGVDGMIELSELAAPGEKPDVKPGDKIEAYVVAVQNRVAELAMSMGKGVAAKAALEDAAQTGVPVEGAITAVNKGGYVVEVAGVRCFCPLGQMDVRRIEDPATMIGQKHRFRITEWRGGRDVVLSRRALLEEEQAARAEETRKRLEPGARFQGMVTNVREFGAFVDFGGVEGLVPASELAWGRQRPQDVVHPGQEVEVEVLRIEVKDGKERIALSMRTVTEDPFFNTVDELPEGTIVQGRVMRLQPFGAFVEIVPGVEGLLHVSAFGKRVGHPSEMVSVGDEIAVSVDAIDRDARRISLSFVSPEELGEILGGGEEAPAAEAKEGMAVRRQRAPEAAAAPAPQAGGAQVLGRTAPKPVSAEAGEAPAPAGAAPAVPSVGTVLDVTVDRIESFGVFVSWGSGRGLVPAAELGVPRGTDLRRAAPVGSTFRAAVSDVRDDGKVRLSKRGAEEAEERAEAKAWMQTQKQPQGKGLGTLGDLLKGKLGK
ncbi:S1 RNA-binding domain-containing protein [Vulgatibacter sp.]|uniref:S1 RNA-binding domain-containing protein n=1 Tax=Vulgatibacter sp. TaxID=1971226 RepID=UPI003563CB50